MKVVNKLKLQIVAIVALALLAVPVAQAKDIALRSFQSGQGETAQGMKADGLRLQALAHVYQSQGGATAQGLKADGLRMQALAQAYQSQGATVPALKADALRMQTHANAYRELGAGTTAPVAPPAAPIAHTGFNWNDAGIGAGVAALAVVLAGLGAGGIVRRRAAHA